MLGNYFKIAVRNLIRRKGFAFLNVGGLAVGIACCLLIFLYVRNELAVNRIFQDVDSLFRVDSEWREPSMGAPATTLAPVGQTLVREFPEVVDQVRIYSMFSASRVGDESYREEVMVADSSLFRLFDVPLLHGDPATALSQPRSIIISEDRAETYFGTSDVLNETISLETWNRGWQSFTITGVRKNLPYNSLTDAFTDSGHDLIIPPNPYGDYFGEDGWTSWGSRYILQYIKLAPGASIEKLNSKLEGFIETYAPEEFHGNLNIRLNPLSTLYLTENGNRGWRVIRLLSAVGILMLLLACINFTNLATAQSFSRIKEIGVRKVSGAQRRQIVGQMLGESLLTSFLAATVGVLLAALCLKPFLQLFEKRYVLESYVDGFTVLSVFGFALVVGLIAGAYPSLFFSNYRPAKALKGVLRFNASTIWLRRSLVVIQLAAAIVLVISVDTVSRQLSFVSGSDLGFRSENMLVVRSVPREWNQAGVAKAITARDRLLEAVPGVQSVSLSWGSATDGAGNTRALLPVGRDRDSAISTPSSIVDDAFLETYDLDLMAGRFFSRDFPGEMNGIVINEKAADALGWTAQEAVGRYLLTWFQAQPGDDSPPERPVIGVVANHHFESLHQPIRPLAYFSVNSEEWFRVMSLRLSGADLPQTVDEIRQVWSEVFPAAPFEYYFLDDNLNQAYRTEQQVRQLVGIAAILAIFIAGMGMLGLAFLSVVQRTKEIGVRKVLGASVSSIVNLFAREFIRLVLAALVLAAPIAFRLMSRWLEGFTYGVALSWQTFAVTGALALVIVWITVSYHSVRAALADPVTSLRYE